MAWRTLVLGLCVAALAACPGGDGGDTDGGADAGHEHDSGHQHDADAGEDAGHDEHDAGEEDAGHSHDGGEELDAGTDAGTDTTCAANFAGCTSFPDAVSGTATIGFPVGGSNYSPKCLRITAGTTVSFNGPFGSHPLRGPCGPELIIPNVNSDPDDSVSVTFTEPGIYGFNCNFHGSASGTGMAGAIEVVP